ncbi:Uncharacterised protein [Chryseobacterium taihuense]|uniref:Uncharacterized protein n=2 Tax=Chryseobacterium TaxID=59732 RepID=A0A101CDP1_9FLAO|nr:hypothetical protein AR686_17400 [Chryseobacterium aquaticum subsp. greenlandense]VFB05001.1 Uncharacterised protein [Chryseobacterium taihuense]
MDYFGILDLILFEIEKQVPPFFFLFAEKARSSLCIRLEKFVYTKTHLAMKEFIFFKDLKEYILRLIFNQLHIFASKRKKTK